MIACPFKFKECGSKYQQGCETDCAMLVIDRHGRARCALSLASDEPRTPYAEHIGHASLDGNR